MMSMVQPTYSSTKYRFESNRLIRCARADALREIVHLAGLGASVRTPSELFPYYSSLGTAQNLVGHETNQLALDWLDRLER